MTLSRFNSMFIFIDCLRHFLIHGRANKTSKNIRTILVIQTAQMGDMVCTTPVFRAIKKFLPNTHLIVVGNKVSIEVLKDNTDVDETFVKQDLNELVRFIKSKSLDYGCVVVPDFSALSALYQAGVPAIVAPDIKTGFSTGSTRFYNLLKKFVITVPYYEGQYFARQYLRLLEPLGIKADDTSKHLSFSNMAENKVEEFMDQNNIMKGRDFIVGFSASAGNKIKVWPAKHFAEVADYLDTKYQAKLLLLGGPKDKEENEKVMTLITKDTQVINCSEVFNIDELKAIISKLDMFISVDTGPIYIAEAFSVPTVDIVGPIDEREQPPIGPKHKVVSLHTDIIKPELTVLNARIYNKHEARRQTEEITPEMVTNATDEIVSMLKNNLKNEKK